MAFRKFANATLVKPDIHFDSWATLKPVGDVTAFTARTAAKVVLQEFDPKKFLLSHVTIMASVDTDESKAPLGRHTVDGFEVDRRFSDYLVTPQTSKFINNNRDAWTRQMLLSSYRTFVGAENYVEHVQIPELSKGKIIDAAARDIGDSLYIDILVATDRKHGPLIDAITGGQLQTLSMGCQVAYTQCTKCGNVAADETQLCRHITYFKGQEFTDEKGRPAIVAELCGHHTEPDSVKFIEASWVANPAFKGAVMRNILNPDDVKGVGKRIQVAFSEGPRQVSAGSRQKAARLAEDEFPMSDSVQPSAPEAASPDDKAMDEAINSMADLIREKALEKVRSQLSKDDVQTVPSENQNNNLVKEALQNPLWRRTAKQLLGRLGNVGLARRMLLGMVLYGQGGWKALRKASFRGPEILALNRLMEMNSKKAARAGTSRIYKTVIAVGGMAKYQSEAEYLSACRQVIGRRLTESEKGDLLAKGYLYALGM